MSGQIRLLHLNCMVRDQKRQLPFPALHVEIIADEYHRIEKTIAEN